MKTQCESNIGVGHSARELSLRATVVLWALGAAGLLPAAQLSLKHNVTQRVGGGVYQGVTDSWMDHQTKYNFGADPDLYVGENSGGVGDAIIMKFELPAVTCQSIQSATQSLWYVDTYGMGFNNTAIQIALFRIKPGYSWYENTGGSGGGTGAAWRTTA